MLRSTLLVAIAGLLLNGFAQGSVGAPTETVRLGCGHPADGTVCQRRSSGEGRL
jgi:hypothetical protein